MISPPRWLYLACVGKTVADQSALDKILAIQFLVAWAGEARCVPKRLGWWETDAVDREGGGNLFARLAPRTAAWGSFEAAREAARRIDAKARVKMADPDSMRSLFFLGFDLDEQLNDRLGALKRSAGEQASGERVQRSPTKMLAMPVALLAGFSAEKLADSLRSFGDGSHSVVPGGRQLNVAVPTAPDAMVRLLAAGLLPLADTYSLPFFKLR